MKNTTKRFLCGFAIFSFLFTQAQNCWLTTKGKNIVNASTQKNVILRAVGLGSWDLQEGYMLHPGNCKGCAPGPQWTMKKIYYDQGVSEEKVAAFYQKWRDNFITKKDIDYIASLGFNSIRFPMHYDVFLTKTQRKVRNSIILDTIQNYEHYQDSLKTWLNHNKLFTKANLEGFKMIDNLVKWCKANHMYIILDLHAAPGGQGTDKNIADTFQKNGLWKHQIFQDVTDKLWDEISKKYNNEPTIALYDILNEPNNVPGGGKTIHPLLQRLINTIRKNDSKHMIMIEGNGWGNNYNNLEPFTFKNNKGLVYNAHRYWIDPMDDEILDKNPNQINRLVNLIAFRDKYNVPVWVGETGENNNEWLSQNIQKLERNNIGWCHWTYKRFDTKENAALMHITGTFPSEGKEVMNEVLEHIKFKNCVPNLNTIKAVTKDIPKGDTTGCNN
ncbi:glycoside hydrolase family 5 protein [Zhouia sp. PK063]|uniref:glycoside hydrolase family 5 protein n=1 Tax=Zhouia sp. PK063 TaxID=3373602 RepID=UPI0037A28D6A